MHATEIRDLNPFSKLTRALARTRSTKLLLELQLAAIDRRDAEIEPAAARLRELRASAIEDVDRALGLIVSSAPLSHGNVGAKLRTLGATGARVRADVAGVFDLALVHLQELVKEHAAHRRMHRRDLAEASADLARLVEQRDEIARTFRVPPDAIEPAPPTTRDVLRAHVGDEVATKRAAAFGWSEDLDKLTGEQWLAVAELVPASPRAEPATRPAARMPSRIEAVGSGRTGAGIPPLDDDLALSASMISAEANAGVIRTWLHREASRDPQLGGRGVRSSLVALLEGRLAELGAALPVAETPALDRTDADWDRLEREATDEEERKALRRERAAVSQLRAVAGAKAPASAPLVPPLETSDPAEAQAHALRAAVALVALEPAAVAAQLVHLDARALFTLYEIESNGTEHEGKRVGGKNRRVVLGAIEAREEELAKHG